MRKTRKFFLIVTILTLGCVCLCTEALASYAVKALLPENQINPDVSYFDLLVTPGQTQTLYVAVKNKDDEEIRVLVEANTAFTSGNGLIEYSYTEERDASMITDFASIVTPVESVVTIPPNDEVVAEFVLAPPSEPFEGHVLGGLVFTKLDQGTSDEESSVAIQNIFQYVIGARLRVSEEAIEPQFELASVEKGATPRETMVINLRNPKPLVAQRMGLTVYAYREGSADPVFTYEKDNIRMAPNSSMAYNVRTADKVVLESGVYSVSVEVSYEDDVWHFEAPLIVE